MSFFSTADILKSLMTGDLIKSVVDSVEFKSALDEVDVEKYVSPELMEQVITNLLSNSRVKNQLRKMILGIIFEMDGDGFHICSMRHQQQQEDFGVDEADNNEADNDEAGNDEETQLNK